MSNLISFFKTPRHKKFDFAPRYYNQDDEERKEQIRRALSESDPSSAPAAPDTETRIRSAFEFRRGPAQNMRKQKSQSNVRLAVIIMILMSVAYLLLK